MKRFMCLIVICSLICLCFTSSAQSSAAEEDDGSADLLEALDNGKLVDTNVDENGVIWETYYDEVTKVLWTQTAGATKDAALESIESGGEYLEAETEGGAGLDYICAFQWLYPYELAIYDDASSHITLHSDDANYVGTCGDSQCRLYRFDACHNESHEFLNICGHIESIVRNSSSFNYCSTYDPAYMDRDSGDVWNYTVDDDTCAADGSYVYYGMAEDGDVACESAWDYGTGTVDNYTKVGQHWFYACDAWHRTQTAYGYLVCVE